MNQSKLKNKNNIINCREKSRVASSETGETTEKTTEDLGKFVPALLLQQPNVMITLIKWCAALSRRLRMTGL